MVRLTDRPDMTLDVYCGRKITIQQQQQSHAYLLWYAMHIIASASAQASELRKKQSFLKYLILLF